MVGLGSQCKLVRSRCGAGWRWSGLLLGELVEGNFGRDRACVRTACRYPCWFRLQRLLRALLKCPKLPGMTLIKTDLRVPQLAAALEALL